MEGVTVDGHHPECCVTFGRGGPHIGCVRSLADGTDRHHFLPLVYRWYQWLPFIGIVGSQCCRQPRAWVSFTNDFYDVIKYGGGAKWRRNTQNFYGACPA